MTSRIGRDYRRYMAYLYAIYAIAVANFAILTDHLDVVVDSGVLILGFFWAFGSLTIFDFVKISEQSTSFEAKLSLLFQVTWAVVILLIYYSAH